MLGYFFCLLGVPVGFSCLLSGVGCRLSRERLMVGGRCRWLLLVSGCRVLAVDFLCDGCRSLFQLSVPSSASRVLYVQESK